MPFLKITQAGFEKFNGYMGDIEFVDGQSVEEISTADCRRLGCIMSVETLDGKNPSATQLWEDMRYQPLSQPSEQKEDIAEELVVEEPKAALFTREGLEKIADEQGISGLREVANEHGVKGRSINELIEELLNLKG